MYSRPAMVIFILCAVIACLEAGPDGSQFSHSVYAQYGSHDNASTEKQTLVYVGTYTSGTKSEGIYTYRMDPGSGALRLVAVMKGIVNPSYLAIDPKRRHLYAVNEVGEFAGRQTGAVSAFSIDPTSGGLTFLNRQSSGGSGPCYVSVHRSGRYVLVANYGGGSSSMLPLDRDGRLGEASGFVQHQGSSINASRQDGPHAHCIVIDPRGRYAFTADLGLDKVLIYQLDLKSGKLLPNDPSSAQIHPGAGPRHFDFHPNGRYAYVINELDSTVTAFAYDAMKGSLRELQTISTLPDNYKGSSNCADIHVAPSGKFLYGSNRGHDSIVIFQVDPATGKLTLVGHESTRGKTPRNFTIDPAGRFLLVANQSSDTIVSFRIDPKSGKLTEASTVSCPTPVCLKIVTLP